MRILTLVLVAISLLAVSGCSGDVDQNELKDSQKEINAAKDKEWQD